MAVGAERCFARGRGECPRSFQWLSSPDKMVAEQGPAEETCWAQWAGQPAGRRDEAGQQTGHGQAQAVPSAGG